MRVGILGGTFDPVHLGHLIIAEEARIRFDLERVLFVPTGQPWLKDGQPLVSGEHRFRMVELAVASNPCFRAARNEIDRPGPTYTVDTLEELRRELGEGHTFYFILGLDTLEQFHRWKDPERILEMCELALVSRPGYQNSNIVAELTLRYPEAGRKLTLVNVPRVEISGTDIRRRAVQGISFRYHVPEPVEQYIRENRLY